MNNFKLTLYLRVSKKNKKGEAPIYIRVSGNGQSSDVCSGIYVNEDNWNSQKSFIKGTKEELEIKKERLKVKVNKVNTIILDLEKKDELFNTKMVTSKLKEKGLQLKKTLLNVTEAYFEFKKQGYENRKHLKSAQKSNDGFSKATVIKVNNFYNKLQNYFNSSSKCKDVYVANVNTAFIEDFKEYCLSLGNKANTIVKEIKILKAILHWATERRIIQMPVFSAKTTYKQTDIKYLNTDELKQVILVSGLTETEEIIRDLFLFGCYTSVVAEDLNHLTFKNVIILDSGERILQYKRRKSLEYANVPLIDQAISILKKYQNNPLCLKGNLLPQYCNQVFNRYLKTISQKARLNRRLTFYMARHTAATTVFLANGMDLHTLSSLMGHTNIKTTQIYAKVLDAEKIKQAKQVSKQIDQIFYPNAENNEMIQTLGFESVIEDKKQSSHE